MTLALRSGICVLLAVYALFSEVVVEVEVNVAFSRERVHNEGRDLRQAGRSWMCLHMPSTSVKPKSAQLHFTRRALRMLYIYRRRPSLTSTNAVSQAIRHASSMSGRLIDNIHISSRLISSYSAHRASQPAQIKLLPPREPEEHEAKSYTTYCFSSLSLPRPSTSSASSRIHTTPMPASWLIS